MYVNRYVYQYEDYYKKFTYLISINKRKQLQLKVPINVSFSCVVKHKDDGQTKFINPNSQRQDRKNKYWVSIESIHKEKG